MSKALALVKSLPASLLAQDKKKRQVINHIETPPTPDWFVRTREQGRDVWYLRFRLTGMFPRRFGPFKSQQRAMLALDAMIDKITDAHSELPVAANEYRMKRKFQQTWGPVIEDDLALAKGGRR